MLKTSKPSKLMLIVLNRPQLPFVCLSVATWRQLCFSALSNHCTILWLMVSICWSHILSVWTKLLSLNYMDGVWPCPKLTTLWVWFSFRKLVSYFFGAVLEKQDISLIKGNGYFYGYWEDLTFWQMIEWSVFCRKPFRKKFQCIEAKPKIKLERKAVMREW